MQIRGVFSPFFFVHSNAYCHTSCLHSTQLSFKVTFASLLSEWVQTLPPSPELLFMALPKDIKFLLEHLSPHLVCQHSSRCIIHKFIFITSPLSLGLCVFSFGYNLFVYLGQNSMTQHDEEQGGRLNLLMCVMLLRKMFLRVKRINSGIKYKWSLMLTSVSTTTKLNYQELYCCCKSNSTKCILNAFRTPWPWSFTERKLGCFLKTFTHISHRL